MHDTNTFPLGVNHQPVSVSHRGKAAAFPETVVIDLGLCLSYLSISAARDLIANIENALAILTAAQEPTTPFEEMTA